MIQVTVQVSDASGTIQPLADTWVTVVRSGTNNDNAAATAKTNAEGVALLNPWQVAPDQLYWVQADTPAGVRLQALLGQTVPSVVVLNELTTIAAIWAAAQFIAPTGYINGPALPMKIVAGMAANLVNPVTGQPSTLLSNPPNGRQTMTLRTLSSLANLLASCNTNPHTLCELLQLTGIDSGSAAATATAALQWVATHPALRCDSVFALSTRVTAYSRPLDAPPTAWTLGVKINATGSTLNPYGGPGNVAFDAKGMAWIANNVVQGSPNATKYSICLNPDGSPAMGGSGPGAVVTSPGLLGPGFGVWVWQDEVWYGNFGWGETAEYKEPEYGVSRFDAKTGAWLGDYYAPPQKPGEPPLSQRTQSVMADSKGNLWCANYESGGVTVLLNDGARTAIYLPLVHPADPKLHFGAFGLACIDTPNGTAAWVTSSTPVGALALVELSGSTLSLSQNQTLGKVMKGVVVDSHGVVWACSGSDSLIYAIEPDGTTHHYAGGGIDGPWGCCLDGEGNLWVANFGPLHAGPEFRGRLSQLRASGTSEVGQNLSPSTGYTLPSDGEPVTLASGDPLYGTVTRCRISKCCALVSGNQPPQCCRCPGAPPCYIPHMRSTGVQIDQAGNVWVCNNWKPDFVNDYDGVDGETANPGGDGMVIFVGLAKPPAR